MLSSHSPRVNAHRFKIIVMSLVLEAELSNFPLREASCKVKIVYIVNSWNSFGLNLRLGWKALHGQSDTWYGLCRSQGLHTSCASRSSTELLSRKWVCVHTGHPAPTYRQPIMSIQSNTEPSALLQNLGEHGDVVWSMIWLLQASQGSAIVSHPLYGASGELCQIKHESAIRNSG
jgi:hypothetical protein